MDRNKIRTPTQMMRYVSHLRKRGKELFPADAPVNLTPITIDKKAYTAAYQIWSMLKTPTGYGRMPKEYGGRRYKLSEGHPDYHPDKWTQYTVLRIAAIIEDSLTVPFKKSAQTKT